MNVGMFPNRVVLWALLYNVVRQANSTAMVLQKEKCNLGNKEMSCAEINRKLVRCRQIFFGSKI